jgi:hypothetical protein
MFPATYLLPQTRRARRASKRSASASLLSARQPEEKPELTIHYPSYSYVFRASFWRTMAQTRRKAHG